MDGNLKLYINDTTILYIEARYDNFRNYARQGTTGPSIKLPLITSLADNFPIFLLSLRIS